MYDSVLKLTSFSWAYIKASFSFPLKRLYHLQMSVPSQQGETPIDSPNRLNMPSNANVNQILQTYFQKKGFNQAELAFIQQQNISSEHNVLSLEQLTKKFSAETESISTETLPDYIKLLKEDPQTGGGDLDAPFLEYRSLREWIHNALDLYKVDDHKMLVCC